MIRRRQTYTIATSFDFSPESIIGIREMTIWVANIIFLSGIINEFQEKENDPAEVRITFSEDIITRMEMKLYPTAKTLYPTAKTLYPSAKMLYPTAEVLYLTAKELYLTAETLYLTAETLYLTAETLYLIAKNLYQTAKKLYQSAENNLQNRNNISGTIKRSDCLTIKTTNSLIIN